MLKQNEKWISQLENKLVYNKSKYSSYFIESLKIYYKKLIVNKKHCKEKLVLGRCLVCNKKERNCVKRDCRCKNVDAYETSAHYCRILVTPLRINAGDMFDVYRSNLTNFYKVNNNIWT
jgi:hypothetical protein